MEKSKKYYSQGAEDVVKELQSSEHGLSRAEARKRIKEFGYNELPAIERESYARIFFRQFKSPLIYILLAAGTIVLAMGETVDAAVIFFVLLFNSVIGSIQEGKAQDTFLALKKFIKGRAVVLRDGKETMVSDREVAIGDIIILREGDKVPADARVIHSNLLKLDEAALTGESIPKLKVAEAMKGKKDVPVMNQGNMVFNGTVVVSGNGRAAVTAIGEDTFLGGIARETLSIDSEFPLKQDILKLSRLVIVSVILISAVLFLFDSFNGYLSKDTFKTAIAIAVSVIPEGLPIVMTLVLASGVWSMSKKNVLVKKLQAVEVLGETKVIAVDKTGTLTKNELIVERIYAGGKTFEIGGSGYDPEGEVMLEGKVIDAPNHPELLLAGKVAALSGNASLVFEKKKKMWKISGDPTEGSMAVFSRKIGFHRDDLLAEMPIIDEIPFNYELKLHASLHQGEKRNFMAVTGSPEAVLEFSKEEWTPSGTRKIDARRRKELQKIFLEAAQGGMRMIGFASCQAAMGKIDSKKLPSLVFGGFFGIKDTLRSEVRQAVKKVTSSGIKVVMITGDHDAAARAIAEDVGIFAEGDKVMSGKELDKMSDKRLAEAISKVSVFSRVTPSHKLKIIKAYQANGIVVAMTGDGVNDALSLTAADIGISMGRIGTEVAKEASDVVLLDDNFANITHGVEEGRNIIVAMKKVVLYLFSTSVGEVLTILGAIFLGMPLPILAAQILWLNLVTDGFLDVALAMDPKDQENRGATPWKKTFIVDRIMVERMLFMAVPMAVGTLYLFSQHYESDIAKAWTVSMTVLAVFQWFNVWNCRHGSKSIFRMDPFSNKFLIGATFIIVSLQLLAVYNPFFQKVLRTVPLEGKDWMIIIAVASSIIVAEEIRKAAYRAFRKK